MSPMKYTEQEFEKLKSQSKAQLKKRDQEKEAHRQQSEAKEEERAKITTKKEAMESQFKQLQ